MAFAKRKIFCDYAAQAWLLPLDARQLGQALGAMAAAAGAPGAAIELRLSDDGEIAALNGAFLDCVGPTNVITFPMGDGGGSLRISLDCVAREALLYGQAPAEHFLRLLAHGLGHLAGLDHGPEMAAIERACFAAGMELLAQWGLE